MSALTTRDALAKALDVVVATHCPRCLRPMANETDWETTEQGERPDLCWEDVYTCGWVPEKTTAEFYADALLASGVVVDAATLADDDGSLAHITACLAYPLRGDFEADQVRLPHERVQHILRVLPAALSERSPR